MSKGKKVKISHVKSFDGQVLTDDKGWNKWKGECATGVQYVFYKAKNPLGKTSTWRKGQKVKGNEIPTGTAIASFRHGSNTFQNDHAAIFVEETKRGLVVYDQYNNPPKPWGKRTLRFVPGGEDYSNNGNLFYVIVS